MVGVDPLFRHGGRLAAARRAFPAAPTPWIDLSTGINPWPYPAPRSSRETRGRLPDPQEVARLEAVAAAAFGVSDPARVVAVAGAESGLRLLPLVAPVAAVAIAGPTYGGHAEAWAASGAEVRGWPDGEDEAGAVVIVNPNNPDGRMRLPGELLAAADRLDRRGGLLIVDESFADLTPPVSVAASRHPALCVLRSFGKTYGLPGVRLGFVIGPPGLIGRLRAAVGDWPLCAEAIAAGLAAYGDPAWLARARRRLQRAAAALDALLEEAGLEVVGGTPLFRLACRADAGSLFATLCAAGILVRPFAEQPDRLRFGLPRGAERPRLRRALGLA